MDVGGCGHWKVRPTFQGKGKNSIGKWKRAGKDGAKSSGQANAQKLQGWCLNCGKTGHQSKDCWASKVTAATESRTIEFSWKGQRCERQVRQRWRKERQVQRCWSTCLESANWKSRHRRRKQARRLVRLTQLNAQRWICAQPRWHNRRS